MAGLGFELSQFLVDLGPRTRHVGPIKAGTSCAALQLGGPLECRKSQCDAGQRALIGVLGALLGLDDFPKVVAALLGVAENVRVAALHLVADAVDDVRKRKMARVLGHLRVEYDLEL